MVAAREESVRHGTRPAKSPLRKRQLRLLKTDFPRYLVIFFLFTLTIALGSGMMIAGGSLLTAYNESYEKYHVEDGYFEAGSTLSSDQIRRIEKKRKLALYKNFYVDESLPKGRTLRVFKNRKDVDKVSVMKGRLPAQNGEVAIDRMFADNNDITVGDRLKGKDGSFTVCGLISMSDHSTMFRSNSDTMFDALRFGTAVTTAGTWKARFGDRRVVYRYSWLFNHRPADDSKAAKLDEKLMKTVYQEAPSLAQFVPQYANQAIRFTGEDFEGDTAGTQVMVYILIAILTFVMGIMTVDRVDREAGEIGTLRALGYTRSELIRHYMALPLGVLLIAALVGNLLGYTLVKDACARLYYNSYSLPPFETQWNPQAFVLTTLIPMGLMCFVLLLMLRRRMQRSALEFLRGQTASKKQQRAFRLPHRMPLFFRFALRVLRQNRAGFILLLCGVFLANFIAVFGLAFPQSLAKYKSQVQDEMLAKHTYMLEVPPAVQNGDPQATLAYIRGTVTKTAHAEPFLASTLVNTAIREEDVSVYGIQKDSRYVKAALQGGVFISSAYAEKFGFQKGDTLRLKEKYKDKSYTFRIDGIYDYEGALAVFMDKKVCAKKLGLQSGIDKKQLTPYLQMLPPRDAALLRSYRFASGYFSDQPITDIKERYIATDIDKEALTSVANQLDHSMGSLMGMVTVGAVLVYFFLMYLLTKLVIEKNAASISMTKVLGFTNGEITRLYLLPAFLTVVAAELITIPLSNLLLRGVWHRMVEYRMNGWLAMCVTSSSLTALGLAGIGLFFVVALIEYFRIRRIPMARALKN